MKKKGLLALIIALVAVFSVSMAACSTNPATITLSETSISIDYGAPKVTLVATVTNASNNAVTWSSSRESVATVSDTGEITPLASGTTIITATLVEDTSVTATCEVKVNPIPVETVSIEGAATRTLVLGDDDLQLTATVAPANATDKVVVWESDDETIATVAGGKVTAIAPGSANITAKSRANNSKIASVAITVERPAITGIEASPTYVTVPINSTYDFAGKALPEHADPAMTWSIVSQSPDTVGQTVIELVNAATGEFKAKNLGTATVKATSNVNNNVASLAATIEVSPEGTNPMIAISTASDFKQIYANPNADYYLTQDIDFNSEILYGANAFMIVDVAVNAATGAYTATPTKAARFVNGEGEPVKHFIDRGVDAYDESTDNLDARFFAPYDPESDNPQVSARYLILSGDNYVPIAQHDLFSDTSGNLETPGSGAGGTLRKTYADYKRIMTNTGNPLGTSGDSRVFHLRSTAAPRDVFGEGVTRFYQAPVITFNGVFDGRGYSLMNFQMRIPTGANALSLGSAQWGQGGVTEPWGQSLFGNIGFRGIVRNVGFTNLRIDLHGQGGLIASQNNGLIENIHISNVRSFTDSGSGDANTGTGFLMGINNPTGRIQNIVFDGTGTTDQIGSGTGANAVFAMAVANRAGRDASDTQIRNIFINGSRFSARRFVHSDNSSDNPSATVERGGYNPGAERNNAHIITNLAEWLAAVDEDEQPIGNSFEALLESESIWEMDSETGWPKLINQVAAPLKVNFTADQINGADGYAIYASPLAANGLDYVFTANVLRTHKVDDIADFVMTYSVRGVAGTKTAGCVLGPAYSDGTQDYIFTIDKANVTNVLTNITFAGVSPRGTYAVTKPVTLPEGVSLTNDDGITVDTLPNAIDGKAYTFGLYIAPVSGKSANPSVTYTVAGNTDTLSKDYTAAQISGQYSYWFFTIPAEDVVGAITLSDLALNLKTVAAVTYNTTNSAYDKTSGQIRLEAGQWNAGLEKFTPTTIVIEEGGEDPEILFEMWTNGSWQALSEGQTYQINFKLNDIDFSIKAYQKAVDNRWFFRITTEMINEALEEDSTQLHINVLSVENVTA